jgi:hypothetical protein
MPDCKMVSRKPDSSQVFYEALICPLIIGFLAIDAPKESKAFGRCMWGKLQAGFDEGGLVM